MRNGEWTWGEGGKEQRKKEKKSTCAQIKKVEKSESVQQETITHPLRRQRLREHYHIPL